MPEQQSRRANPVTTAPIDSPFETHLVRLGVEGLNLNDELDVLKPGQLARMTNADHNANSAIAARAGQTSFATASGTHHSVRKLRDPQAGTTTRVWGVGSDLYLGASGALALVDSGYSGDPLTLVPHRPPLSGDSWMFVADRSRMRKVRADALDLPIGLPAPGAAPTAAFANLFTTSIAAFDTSDGTEAAQWTGTAGEDDDGKATNAPTAADAPGLSGNAVEFTTQPGTAITAGYDSWWGIAIARNLNTLQGGAVDASDDDLMHFFLQLANASLIAEIRIYLVVSTGFNASTVPGTDPDGLVNTDAYLKTIRQHDFTLYTQAQALQIDAAETARVQSLRDERLDDLAFDEPAIAFSTDIQARRDPVRRKSVQGSPADREWTQYGHFEIPLRRGDFERVGSDDTRTWGTVTGLLLYVSTIPTATESVAFRLDDFFLHGGRGLDTTPPGSQRYDWRYTHYDPRTGAESNGSPIMALTAFLDVDRKEIAVTPAAVGDSAVRQRVYRRGGQLFDDWFFCGTNSSDGGIFVDTNADDAISAASSLPIDHFQPVPTVDENGATVLAQPLPALWGPVEGMIFGCGDPYRPGHVYFCTPDAPDHWSASGNVEVCPPSEQLMHGGLLGHQAFALSRDRLYMLYPNLSGTAGTVTAAPTLCKRGLWSRWGFCVGPKGVYFVAEDGVFVSAGGPEEWISRDLDPLFRGETKHGYLPIDKADVASIRLTIWENKLYFQYTDTGGARQVMVYSLLYTFWRHYDFALDPTTLQGQEEEILLIGAANATYTHEGTSDGGTAIGVTLRTGAFTGGKREEKLFGDMIVDADRQGVAITVTNYLNEETVTNLAQSLAEGTGRNRFVLDSFGDSPQKAHSLSTEIGWSTAGASPIVYQIGYALILQPEITTNRVTNWDDLGQSDEFWVSGVTFDCDTGGSDLQVMVERDYGGVVLPISTFIVNCTGRHKVAFSWLAVPARQIRVRPSDQCRFWMLYRADWIWQPEPPRISKWDVLFENAWDQYYTGLDLYCNTINLQKDLVVTVDEAALVNPATGLSTFPVVANGRRVVHLTFTPGRGHVFRFYATDANEGLLYSHRWHLEPEPTEQANWLQNFSILGTRADKYLKAIVFECDTFGQNKSVQIEVDGAVAETLVINSNGRGVVQRALATQRLGRVWRMLPVDGNPGRLYSAQPIFDEEPFQLTRWETQETNHGLPGWFYPLSGQITLKSTADVTLTIALQINQRGTTVTETYTIPSTAGQKLRHFQSFRTDRGGKGVLIKYTLTSTAAFYVYREETSLLLQPWGAEGPIAVQPFGDDAMDPTRPMRQATYAAMAPGGSLGDQA